MTPELVLLRDASSGASAKILCGYGFNCFSFQPVVDGRTVELIWAADGFESGQLRASSSGIPVLFPFPGRIRDSRFCFGGRQFTLQPDAKLGVAIHGFVYTRAWRVIERSAVGVTGQFQASIDDPSILEHWPADFRITMHYEVRGSQLTCHAKLENPDSRPLPCGFGVHPYLRMAPGGQTVGDDCRVTVPVQLRYELDADKLPTGQRSDSRDLSQGARFADLHLDDVFSGVQFQVSKTGEALAIIDDLADSRRVTLSFGEQFSYVVVFTPPHREAICIEPYTSLPDAFTLAARGVATGMRVLLPGESFSVGFQLGIEPL